MRSIAFLLALTFTAATAEENLIKNAGFEEPVVKARTPEEAGGNPTHAAEDATSWTHFQAPIRAQDKTGGKIVVGLTNEYARSGKQSIFVDFQQLTAPQRRSFLMTDILPVKGGHRYRVGLWGRIDRKRPLSLDQRRPLMKVEIEYFAADQETQSGSTEYRTQMIPGSLDRLLFTSVKWTEYFTLVRTPEDAAFMKVSFRWETDRDAGMTDGTIYFDDATLEEVPGGESLAPVDPATIKPAPAEPTEPEPAKPEPPK